MRFYAMPEQRKKIAIAAAYVALCVIWSIGLMTWNSIGADKPIRVNTIYIYKLQTATDPGF